MVIITCESVGPAATASSASPPNNISRRSTRTSYCGCLIFRGRCGALPRSSIITARRGCYHRRSGRSPLPWCGSIPNLCCCCCGHLLNCCFSPLLRCGCASLSPGAVAAAASSSAAAGSPCPGAAASASRATSPISSTPSVFPALPELTPSAAASSPPVVAGVTILLCAGANPPHRPCHGPHL